MLNKQNLFEETFSLHRETTDEIYKGFGFRHFSDVTDYYISPQNESEYGTTVLSQPVGEAVVLGYEFLKSFFDNKPIGKLYYNEQKQRYFAEIFIPQDWRDNNVFPQEIFCYRAHIVVDEIKISAYNKYDEYITFDHSSSLLSRYKICMFFFIVLMRSFFENDKIKNDIIEFIRNYTKENFVVLCEDFYQHNKNLCVNSKDYWGGGLKDFKTVGYEKFSITCIPEMQQALQPVIISCFDDNEFSAEQLNLIPLLGSEFVLEDNLEKLCNAITFGDVRTVLFHGPAGTGKTISCKLICKTIRLPILETVNCTENLDEFILGKFIPENGKIVFKESYVTKAIREGGAVVFEEINFAKPQYLAFLNSLLDDNGFVRLDNGEIVRRHKNFRFFATMNIGYFGTKQLNQALYNRFNAVVEIPQLSDTAIKRMLLTRIPECSDKIDNLLRIYRKIKKKISEEEVDLVISPRNLENWVSLAQYEGYVEAAEKTIIPIAKCDRVLEETFRSIIGIYNLEV